MNQNLEGIFAALIWIFFLGMLLWGVARWTSYREEAQRKYPDGPAKLWSFDPAD